MRIFTYHHYDTNNIQWEKVLYYLLKNEAIIISFYKEWIKNKLYNTAIQNNIGYNERNIIVNNFNKHFISIKQLDNNKLSGLNNINIFIIVGSGELKCYKNYDIYQILNNMANKNIDFNFFIEYYKNERRHKMYGFKTVPKYDFFIYNNMYKEYKIDYFKL